MKFQPIQRLSLQDQIYDLLLKAIQNGDYRPGEKLPSIPTLAERFNVSISPTRLAIQKLDENGFVESRHGSGTYVIDPVERFSERDSACICLDYNAHLTSEVYSSIVLGLQGMGKFGFGLNPNEENFPLLLEKFLKSETRIFIYLGNQYFPYDLLKPELTKGKTFVSVLRGVEPLVSRLNASTVINDLHAGTNKVIDYLRSKGHKHILVTGTDMMIDRSFSKYKTDPSEMLINCRKHKDITFSKLSSNETKDLSDVFDVDKLLALFRAKNGPTAVLGLRDWEVSVIQKLLASNDHSLLNKLDLVGFANTPYSKYSTYPFSTLDLNINQIAQHVCRIANMVFRQKSFKPEHIVIEPELIIRDQSNNIAIM